MEFLLRYFIDGNEFCEGHKWTYTHAAQMIIPRIGERVWVDDHTCVEVDMVTYSPSPDCFNTAIVEPSRLMLYDSTPVMGLNVTEL